MSRPCTQGGRAAPPAHEPSQAPLCPPWVGARLGTTSALLSLPDPSRPTHRGASPTSPSHPHVAPGRELLQGQGRAQGHPEQPPQSVAFEAMLKQPLRLGKSVLGAPVPAQVPVKGSSNPCAHGALAGPSLAPSAADGHRRAAAGRLPVGAAASQLGGLSSREVLCVLQCPWRVEGCPWLCPKHTDGACLDAPVQSAPLLPRSLLPRCPAPVPPL